MTPANDTLTAAICRRAFLTRNVRQARRLLRLAEESLTIKIVPGEDDY